MQSEYTRKKRAKATRYNDMEHHTTEGARREFERAAYAEENEEIRRVIGMRIELRFLLNHTELLDDWERDTIRRIVKRIRGTEKGGGEESNSMSMEEYMKHAADKYGMKI